MSHIIDFADKETRDAERLRKAKYWLDDKIGEAVMNIGFGAVLFVMPAVYFAWSTYISHTARIGTLEAIIVGILCLALVAMWGVVILANIDLVREARRDVQALQSNPPA